VVEKVKVIFNKSNSWKTHWEGFSNTVLAYKLKIILNYPQYYKT